jgi:hypothetical protein
MNQPETQDPSNTPAMPPEPPTVSGKLVVLVMFAFAAGLVALLYLYWEMHTRPFRPLQYAINEMYPGCQPRVVGGRYKSHLRNTPNTLRIVITVKFDPQAPESAAQSEEIAQSLANLAVRHLNVFAYDVMEIHLVQPVPENEPRVWSRTASPEEWGLHPNESPPNS